MERSQPAFIMNETRNEGHGLRKGETVIRGWHETFSWAGRVRTSRFVHHLAIVLYTANIGYR